MSATNIVLAKDDYDALEFAALVHNGVGGYRDFVENNEVPVGEIREDHPVCMHGLSLFLDPTSHMSDRLVVAGLGRNQSDRIASSCASQIALDKGKKVSWKEYVKAGHIVRGK